MLKSQQSDMSGFTLIEVIITAFILAVGLLSVVAMQAIAKQSSFESQQRTVASFLAEDMVERVRLNIIAWQDNNPGAVSVGLGQAVLARPACASTDDSGELSACTLAQIVASDLYSWQYALSAAASGSRGGLVTPTACVQLSATGELTVVVSWKSRQALNTPESAIELVKNCGASSEQQRRMVLQTQVAV